VPVPVPYENLSNPQTLNLYAMVSDDPESFADLDGHCCDGDGIGDTIGRFFATAIATWASDNAGRVAQAARMFWVTHAFGF
jgi:hypothetical protein